jgi:hypothetical protein
MSHSNKHSHTLLGHKLEAEVSEPCIIGKNRKCNREALLVMELEGAACWRVSQHVALVLKHSKDKAQQSSKLRIVR